MLQEQIKSSSTYKTAGVEAVQITDKFAGAVEIIGKTFVIDSNTGEKEWINLIIPQFLPDSVSTLQWRLKEILVQLASPESFSKRMWHFL